MALAAPNLAASRGRRSMKQWAWRLFALACGLLAGGAVLAAAVSGVDRSPSWPVMVVIWHGSIVIGVVVGSYVGSLRR